MRRWLKRGLLAAAVCALALPALAFMQWADGAGNLLTGTVTYWINASGLAVPATSSAPLPTGSAPTNNTATLSMPSATAAYAAGQLIASSATAGSIVVPAVSLANGAGPVTGLRLSSNDSTSTAWGGQTIQVDLWTVAPTFGTGDRTTWAMATGSASHLRSFSCVMSGVNGDGVYGECAAAVGSFALPKLASGTALYWTLLASTGSGVTGVSKTWTLTAEALQ